MLTLHPSTQYKKDRKRLMKQNFDLKLLDDVLELLIREQPLPPRFSDHLLKGDYAGHRECHIRPDWLLIYAVDKGRLILTATRTGTHSELFS
jgi:mRNA interferase YafQ